MDISILLPTRGRSDLLMNSLNSIYDSATNFDSIEIIFGLDNDDVLGLENFLHKVVPWIEERKGNHKIQMFNPMGYHNLHQYANKLAEISTGNWLFLWNDDAVMKTQGWDDQIRARVGEFKLLSVITHNEHPYSIFPIIPRDWYTVLGHLSQHSLVDSYTSSIAYCLDIFERIPIYCSHERADLTGKNNDATFQNRIVLEGDKSFHGDINHPSNTKLKMDDAAKLAQWLQDERGQDMQFFANCCAGTQDPWEKLKANDTNNQVIISLP